MSIENKVKKKYDLTPLTAFKIGGKAEFFITVNNQRELIDALHWSQSKKIPWSIIGGGSNILIIRKKIRGLVIKISGEGYNVEGSVISAWVGTGMAKLAKIALDHGLSGLEWAMGIPGSLGGAVRGNAGAYGGSIAKQVAIVEAYDSGKNMPVKLSPRACAFGYRHSVFKQRPGLIIMNVKLKLAKGTPAKINSLSKNNFQKRRLSNSRQPSAGCVFKNLEYEELIKQNYRLAKELKIKNLVKAGKVPAGFLIDQVGLKGKTRGGAEISGRHANFIVNTGGATVKDVIYLIDLIKRKVKSRFNVNLEEEIQYFG